MDDTLFWSRMRFGFTITYHYLFPQLTMGLAWIIVYLKWRHLRTGDERFGNAARFWARIFGINFAIGVVTGIPMEFQFGTNWANFSKFSGNIIGQTLAMEGMFAFFLESALIGAMVWGEKRLGPRNHFLATLGVAVGSWLSGYFILTTNAFMQHPAGYVFAQDESLRLASLGHFLLNPWAMAMFLHNQCAALVTGSFVVSAIGAGYALAGIHPQQARLFLKTGTIAGLISCLLVAMAFPCVMADMSAGFYLAVMLLIWCLIFRGVAMEVSGRISDPLWHTAWNFIFVASNVALAILIGAALGNIVRGVPLGADGKFALPFFTNFSPFGQVDILDWYTISGAVFTLVLFAAHGANGLALRTNGPVHDRSLALSRRLWSVLLTLLIVIAVETGFVRPNLITAVFFRPIGWLGLIGVILGALAIHTGLRRGDAWRALTGSTC